MGKWPQSLESNGPFLKIMGDWSYKMGRTWRQYRRYNIFSSLSLYLFYKEFVSKYRVNFSLPSWYKF